MSSECFWANPLNSSSNSNDDFLYFVLNSFINYTIYYLLADKLALELG